jgi:carbon monoxide dehydrogenase subunit G
MEDRRLGDVATQWSDALMVIFKDSQEVPAPLDRVWDIIADVDNEPQYCPGLNTVRNISKTGNVIEREVTVGFRDSRGRPTVVLHPKESVEVTMTEGPMKGTRIVKLSPSGDKTKIDISWDFELVGIPLLFRGNMKNQIMIGTRQALNRIVRAVQ